MAKKPKTGGAAFEASKERIKSFLERHEQFDKEKSDVAETLKELKAEFKADGFDVKMLVKAAKLKRADGDKQSEADMILTTYLEAIGQESLLGGDMGPGRAGPPGDADKKVNDFIRRFNAIEDEAAELAEQIKELKSEYKNDGYDVPTLTKIVALRKMDPEKLEAENAIFDLYKTAAKI